MSLFGILTVSPVHYIAVPLFAAFLLPLLTRVSKVFAKILPGIVLLYLIAVTAVLYPAALQSPIVEVIAGWKPPLGINLYYGPLGAFLVTIFTLLGFLVWLYSLTAMRQEPLERFYILFMMIIAGATGIVLTGDIFNLFVFLEITAISAYSLTAFLRENDRAEAGFKYILLGSLASAFILLGIALLYAYTGTLNLADLATKIPELPINIRIAVFVLFLVGFGIEAEIFPLNGWAPDAYSAAPPSIAALFAGVTVKAAVYALFRVSFLLFPFVGSVPLLSILGLITLVVAELAALQQTNTFRMLAYSSIGQMGLVVAAFGIGTANGAYGALFSILNHATIKPLLFLAAANLVVHSLGKNLDSLNGMGRKKPFTSLLFTIGALAIIGLPPFSGFWGKFYILTAMAESHNYAMIAIVLAVTIVESVYYLRIVTRLYLKEPESETTVQKSSFVSGVVLSTLTAVILFVGFYPASVESFLNKGAQDLLDTAQYPTAVLGEEKGE